MTCPHCGAQVPEGNRFCSRCRKRVIFDAPPAAASPAPAARPAPRPPAYSRPAAPVSAASSFKRPMIVTILGVLNVVGGGLALAAAAFMTIGGLSSMKDGGAVMAVIGAVYGVVGIVQIATGVGLLGLKPWSRSLQIGLAVIGLLGIPCGTIIGILILVYMLKPEVKLLFSGASPQELAPEEREMVERLGQSSGAMVALVAVLVALVGIAVVGIIAAIAIPSLLRARVSANESATIGDLRTMVSAQAAYASANAGFYDKVECLARPVACIPGYPPAGPPFLDASLTASEVRHGYQFRFVPGVPAGFAVQGKASPSSLTGWTYLAEPVTPNQTGVRAFCAEASGVICFETGGRLGQGAPGACPASCRPLR